MSRPREGDPAGAPAMAGAAAGAGAMPVGLLLGGLHTAEALGDLAAEAEALGYASLWTGDHVAFPSPILDPLQTLACFATRTRRVRLGTCVYLLALRHPTVVAKMVASLDVLSGGRLVFGIGVGGEFPGEFHACGVPVRERGARTNEGIAALRSLWTGGEASHRGRFFDIGPVCIAPPPAQGPQLPIWIGGRAEPALRRAARLGDGYVGYLLDPEGFRRRMERVVELAAAAGRPDGAVAPALMTFAVVDDDRAAARSRAGAVLGAMYGRPMEGAAARYCVTGSAADCRAAAAAYAAAGCGHLILAPLAFGDGLREQIRRLAGALGLSAEAR
jgi:probable F420-dependent oxidoreductase